MKGKIVKYILIGAAVAVVVEAAKRYLTQCGVTDDADYDTDPENDDTEDGDDSDGFDDSIAEDFDDIMDDELDKATVEALSSQE